MVTFYAWASPAFFGNSLVDHTWITTYDNQKHFYPDAGAVARAGQDYWFCWGDYRSRGGIPGNPTGFLGQKSGNLSLARCLVRSNAHSRHDPAAQGTIFLYGRHGVCHQLSNQVLYATTGSKLTVRNARGYFFSSALYGTYGLNVTDWANKVQSCSSHLTAGAGIAPMGGVMQPESPQGPDEFAKHAAAILAEDDPELLERLLALRMRARIAAEEMPQTAFADAEIINARNQEFLDRAAELLGPLRFQEVFGFPAGEKVDLVDPAMLGNDTMRRE